MQRLLEYINYYFASKGRHGIHSPFVYELVDKCLNTPVERAHQAVISSIIQTIKADQTVVHFCDFGAGSRKMGSTRTPRQMYKNSSSKGKYGRLLYQLSKHYQFQNMLELGTSLGIGSTHLKIGNDVGHLTTVEGCPETHLLANKYGEQNGLEINYVQATFVNFINELTASDQFDFMYIDGHHDGDALLHYIELLEPHMLNDTILLIDDIRWSDSMRTAWNTLVSRTDFHLSIDFFRMGLLAKRQQQEKEHFVLKLRR